METTELIHKSSAELSFGNTKEQIATLATNVAEVEIFDESSLSIATNISVRLNGILKKIDSKRKELKNPYLKAGKIIDEIAKELSENGNAAIASAKAKILFYNDRMKEAKVAELSQEDTQFALAQEEIMAHVSQEPVKGIRKSWTYKIVNHDEIPLDWMCLDIEKVKAYMAANKDILKEGHTVNGIEFYKQETVVLR